MAGKWAVFFHRIYTLLSNRQGVKKRRGSSLAIRWFSYRYLTLAVVTTSICLFAFSGATQVVITPTSNLTAQHTPERSLTNSSNSPSELEQLDQSAREHYAAGQFQDAATGFQQAAQRYQAQGDPIRQSLSLTNLSLSYQQLGLWKEATEAIDESLDLVERDDDLNHDSAQQSALAQALDARGNLELSRGQTEQAIATWERAATLYQQLGEPESALQSQINQARALQNLGMYSRAILVLETALQVSEPPGSLSASLGDDEQSPEAKRQLLAFPDSPTTVVGLRTLAEALQVTGVPNRARIILEFAETLAQTHSPIEDAVTELSIGNAIRTQAMAHLRSNYMTPADAIAKLQEQPSLIQRILQKRQIETAKQFDQQTQEVLEHYQQSAANSKTATLQLQALLNRLGLLLERRKPEDVQVAAALVPEIEALLATLPEGTTATSQLNFARSLLQLADSNSASRSEYLLKAAQLLKTAQDQAIQSGDFQAESYALGLLSEVYEQNQQLEQAQDLIEQALQKVYGASAANVPHAVNDTEIAYRWQRQLGRILKAQNNIKDATTAYEEAIAILQKQLQLDVGSSNQSYRFAFLQEAKQVHQELLDLLLWDGRTEEPSQQSLQRAREIITSLLETEVTSFLQEPCDVATPEEIDNVVKTQATTSAIIYPIVLPSRLELVVKLPQQNQLVHYRQSGVTEDQVLKLIKQLQQDLEEDYTFEAVEQASHQLYQWIVEPVEDELALSNVDTLVFALTEQLQRIPMAALFDGNNKYLIERYAVSEVLGLRFNNPTVLERQNIKVLAAGVATMPDNLRVEKIQQNFLPLPNVAVELARIEATEGESFPVMTLTNEEFTRQNFNTRLNEERFSVVHLATHGQFSFDPADTFLITFGDEPKIDVNELAALFRVRGQIRPEPIELLVLNACETAAGDELATLGIAGAAVRAGARSVIASLWALGDAPGLLFSQELYKYLGQPEVELNIDQVSVQVKGSKAQALRQAQLKLKQDPRYEHPRYWAPYILAGNWL